MDKYKPKYNQEGSIDLLQAVYHMAGSGEEANIAKITPEGIDTLIDYVLTIDDTCTTYVPPRLKSVEKMVIDRVYGLTGDKKSPVEIGKRIFSTSGRVENTKIGAVRYLAEDKSFLDRLADVVAIETARNFLKSLKIYQDKQPVEMYLMRKIAEEID